MAYHNPNTAEWWELVASGYRQLAENPPKFLAPGSTIDGFREKAEEAEREANKMRRVKPVETPPPEKAEGQMKGCGRGYAIKQLLMKQSFSEVAEAYKPPRVTKDIWDSVLGLD